MRGVNNSVETINAAATAILAAENRVQQSTVQKRRWGGCLSVYWCFGSQKQGKRIGHAVLVPESSLPGTEAPSTEISIHQSTLSLPFIAPPSSPASFFQSEPQSATQSPAGLLSLSSFSSTTYSPGGPNNIFAIGPYANETQLVSPPVFSTFTTEPSTAPLTPPPEPIHFTTPSSPEVPFARLLASSLDHNQDASKACRQFSSSHYEFQSYQLYPGSPVCHLISPSSAVSGSGTSSPFPESLEFPSNGYPFPPFPTMEPPKLLTMDGLYIRKPIQQDSETPNPAPQDNLLLESQISAIASLANSDNGSENDGLILNHRVSFELTAEEDMAVLDEAITESPLDPTVAGTKDHRLSGEVETTSSETSNALAEEFSGKTEEQHRRQPSLTVGGHKEFKFDNTDGASDAPVVGSDWWANEKVVGPEAEPRNKWAFFPMIQPGVS
ncbi:hydroxyproline-rich glycoprotein family protein [Tasmannia lanceolata]|uniref:hydroxyproline-rich glycoprotein family protein n=1 Tax=Tasmannia lanceolata TaxID=3420 RepID=UPI00406300BF